MALLPRILFERRKNSGTLILVSQKCASDLPGAMVYKTTTYSGLTRDSLRRPESKFRNGLLGDPTLVTCST